MMDAFTMPAETTSERFNGSFITRHGHGRYGGEYRNVWAYWLPHSAVPYYRYVGGPDFHFNPEPCHFCESRESEYHTIYPRAGRIWRHHIPVCAVCHTDIEKGAV